MPDIAPKSVSDTVGFPDPVSATEQSFDEVAVRLCLEPGCDEPCIKRGRGYAKWCADHLFNHPNSPDKAPASRTLVVESKAKVREKARDTTIKLLSVPQTIAVAANDQYCAYMIGEIGPSIADNAGDIAANSKWVANKLAQSEMTLAIAMLTVNVTRLGLAIAVHHGVVPYSGAVKLIVPKPPNKTDTEARVSNLRVVDQDANINNSFA